MERTIGKKTSTNKLQIILDSKTRQEYIDKLYVQQEILNDSAVEIFLTAVGMEVGGENETNAQAMARRIMNSHPPGELKKRFDYYGAGCTRTDLSEMYLDYLTKSCSIDWFSALGSVEDDQLWYAFFPKTVYTCRTVKDLPSITGDRETVKNVVSIRRRQITELLILGDLFNQVSSNSGKSFIDKENSGNLPNNVIALFSDARQHIYKTLDILSSCTNAEEWLTKKSINYNVEWIKGQIDLYFFNPASVQFTQSGMDDMLLHRQLLFELS